MLVEVYDDDIPAVVWLFCGTTNDDGDHDRWLSSMTRLDRAGRMQRGSALLIIDDGNPPPPKHQRDALTKTARSITGDTPLAVVTSSSVARTIIAGLNLTGVVAFPLRGFADVTTAIAWLESQRRQSTAPALQSLVDEARARAALKGV